MVFLFTFAFTLGALAVVGYAVGKAARKEKMKQDYKMLKEIMKEEG